MGERRLLTATWTALWTLLVLVAFATRPLLPIDETRYASVAWEMWAHGEFLVPQLNGEPYSHKPPLLFWLIHLGWSVLGVNEWWPRLVPPLFGLASIFLVARVARQLWPEDPRIARFVPLIVLGSPLWTLYTTALLFDMLLACFTLVAISGLLTAARGGARRGWLTVGVAIGLGVLAKGPVMLVYTLPPALLAPLWAVQTRPERWVSWYLGLAGAVVVGTLIALLWAVPAGLAGGEAYREAIFWGQTADRVVESFAHRRSWWWYFPLLPVLLFPWWLWPPVWRGLRRAAARPADSGVRLCLAWLAPVFIAFILISGKQVHYLLPLLPAFGLLVARLGISVPARRWDLALPGVTMLAAGAGAVILALQDGAADFPDWVQALPGWAGPAIIVLGLVAALPVWMGEPWRVLVPAGLSVAAVVVLHLGPVVALAPNHDLRSIAQVLRQAQEQGRPVGHVSSYHGQYSFLGRLRRPIEVLHVGDVAQWFADHPDGILVNKYVGWRTVPGLRQVMKHGYRGGRLEIVELRSGAGGSETPREPAAGR